MMQPRARSLFSPLVGMCTLLMLLAGCSASSSSNAAVSTACPTRAASATGIHSVTGTVAALTATSASLTTTQGNVTVLFTSTTRVTVLTAAPRSTLTTGTSVQVFAGQASTTGVGSVAQRILVQTGTSPFGSGGRGNGSGRGGFNPACRAATTGAGAAFRGVRGTITAVDLDLNQCTVTDAQGASYVFTLATTTVVATQAAGTVQSLKVGDTLIVLGQQTTAGVQAATIQDQTTHA